jgi:Ca2+-binding EF-hand superfamily protein
MRNVLIFTLLAVFSLGTLAEHHKGDHDGKARHHKGMLKQVDQDGDGVVSTQEHEQALEKMADKRRERFSKMDSNGDGSLTKEEIRAAKQERREIMKEKRQQQEN